MKTLFKYLRSESGQFAGGFWQGLASGLERTRARQDAEKERSLREKLLNLQVQKEERAQQEQIRQNAATEKLADLLGQGVETPGLSPETTTFSVPQEGELPNIQAPQPMPTYRRPASQQELYGAMAQAQPKEFITNILRQKISGGGQGLEEFQKLLKDAGVSFGPEGSYQATFRMGPTGPGMTVSPRQDPREIANAEYLRGYRASKAAGKDDATARADGLAAAQQVWAGRGLYSSAGTTTGRTETELYGGVQSTPQQIVAPPAGQPAPAPTPQGPSPQGPIAPPLATPSPSKTPSPHLQLKEREGAATAQGRRSVEAQEKLLGMSGLKTTVDRIDTLAKKVPAPEPGIDRLTTGGMNWVGAMLQTNPDAAELENKSKAYANILNRSLLAERGVITDADRQFAIQSIPSIWDTKEMRQRKMASFKGMTDLLMWGEEQLANGKLDIQTFRQRLDNLQAVMGGGTQQGGNPQAENTYEFQGKKYKIINGQPFEVRTR